MKLVKTTAYIGAMAILGLGFSACQNASTDFPDHQDGIVAYFANQYPVRTIVLGDDPEQDVTMDNAHKCMIYATSGGTYSSPNLTVNVAVDPSLVSGLTFEDGTPVQVMPASHYTLASTAFTKKKDFLYGSEVTLTDAFFADPKALQNTYVIPLVITGANGADRILTGTPIVEGTTPARQDANAWSVKPQDYVLYCVKYINPWDAWYLRHGVDNVTEGAEKSTIVRHTEFVEKNEVVKVTTSALNKCIFPISTQVVNGGSISTLTCELELTFNGDDCTITSATPGMTASGSGKFVINGEKQTYMNEDHNALYLNYTIDFGPKQYQSVDTLTFQSRCIVKELFNPTYNN